MGKLYSLTAVKKKKIRRFKVQLVIRVSNTILNIWSLLNQYLSIPTTHKMTTVWTDECIKELYCETIDTTDMSRHHVQLSINLLDQLFFFFFFNKTGEDVKILEPMWKTIDKVRVMSNRMYHLNSGLLYRSCGGQWEETPNSVTLTHVSHRRTHL